MLIQKKNNMDDSSDATLQKATIVLISLAILKVVLHFWVNLHDNLFRDEFYYIACGQHLSYGYVDHPPFVALVAAVTQALFGDSLFALRLPAVLAGGLIVFLTGRLARELGGGLFAQGLAALAMLVMPGCLAMTGIFSMNVFDNLFWLLSAYLLVLIVKDEIPLLWILLGVVLGIGLMNKISMLFFGFGLFAALILTPQRRWFQKKWLWITGAISFAIFLPYILWQIGHGWPTLEFMNNARLYKNLPLSPLEFMKEQFFMAHPFLLPVWLAGVYWYLFNPVGKRFRLLGWIYIIVLALLITMKGKAYYLIPVYSMLFAAGGVCIDSAIQRIGWNWLKPVLIIIIAGGGILIAPIALPILSPDAFITYSRTLGIEAGSGERHKQGALPQLFADRHGWEEMVETVVNVYLDLPSDERTKCVIVAKNYGEAGAIDYFGNQYDLPKAICGHNSYFLWGPGESKEEIAIAVGHSRDDLENFFDDVQQVALHVHDLAMPYESNLPVYLCREPKKTLQEIWPDNKHYR